MPKLLATRRLLEAVALALGALCSPLVALAQQSGSFKPTEFPPAELFRQLQLDTLACGRENTAATCNKARGVADPLLDHPLLPASCKDNLWNIRERAVVSPSNSYERRERLNREATDVTVLCRPATKPLGSGSSQTPQNPQRQGGLGGFLKGITGNTGEGR